MKSIEILNEMKNLVEYCKSPEAKRSEIIKRLKDLEDELNGVLPFD